MNPLRSRPRLVPLCLLAALATAFSGCTVGNYLFPAPLPREEFAVTAHAVPLCQRDRVHIFLVNAIDPFCTDNFSALAEHIHDLGFANTYLGLTCDTKRFETKIREIHAARPEARFVLVGYGSGAKTSKCIAQDLHKDGIQFDLLAYIGGDTLKNSPEYRPENVHHILNITGQGSLLLWCGLVYNGVDIDGAENVRLAETCHAGLPTDPKALAVLDRNLCDVAASAGIAPPPAVVPAKPLIPEPLPSQPALRSAP
jgi:hypothetical protein